MMFSYLFFWHIRRHTPACQKPMTELQRRPRPAFFLGAGVGPPVPLGLDPVPSPLLTGPWPVQDLLPPQVFRCLPNFLHPELGLIQSCFLLLPAASPSCRQPSPPSPNRDLHRSFSLFPLGLVSDE